ncbi:M56 family metallopeptidase [Sphingobacterium sp. SYP-B4668]|uniref:M56 family metallopeptidase n=1 Tax=Sphingobacterium sp. SYP-B4668 TaxID=2996035 RepID=UPI0022DD2A68|nr:M56 family metallopeptidase [Sphingobacterium sp. SYP-B4668]
MENLLNYVIQVNVLLAIVYLGYKVMLKGLTFYGLNRFYFLSGILFSFAYPFIDLRAWFAKPLIVMGDYMTYIPNGVKETNEGVALLAVLIGILTIGMCVLAIKFLAQLGSLVRIHLYSKPAQWRDYIFRNVWIPIVPFSFMNRIYVNKDLHEEIELLDIFHHEEIHVKGKHTLDILLGEATLILCWYSPFVWMMRRAIRQNLEFLTDQQVLNRGVDKQTYQYSLLHVTKQGAAIGIGNQFNFKTLKLRIMMMNKRRSSKLQLSKYAFMLPLLIFTAGALTIDRAEAKIENIVSIAKETVLDVPRPFMSKDTVKQVDVQPVDKKIEIVQEKPQPNVTIRLTEMPLDNQPIYFLEGKQVDGDVMKALDPNRIEGISILKGEAAVVEYGPKAVNGAILITLKDPSKAKTPTEVVDSLSTNRLNGKVTGIRVTDKADSTNRISLQHMIKTLNGEGSASTSKVSNLNEVSLVWKTENRLTEKVPLFIVDGVVKDYRSGENDLDPNTIRSISVLKNDAANALYGEKGKNGVILVTTKSGKEDKGAETVGPNSTSVTEGRKLDTITIMGYGKKNNNRIDTIKFTK